MSTGAIVDNAGLLKSVFFPRAILPIGTVLFNLAQYLLTVSVFLPAMMLWYRVAARRADAGCFPLFLALQVVFTIGVALILATATAFFRDVRHLLEVALAVLFWTTPIVYELRAGAGAAPVADPAQPGVALRRRVPADFLLPGRGLTRPSGLVASAYALGAFVVGALLFLTLRRPVHGAAVSDSHRGAVGLQAVPAQAQRVGRAQGAVSRAPASGSSASRSRSSGR